MMSSQSSVRCPKCGAERGGRNDDDAGCNRHSPMEPWQLVDVTSEHSSEIEGNEEFVSDCCEDTIATESGDDGTSWYVCLRCGNPCDGHMVKERSS